MSQNTINLYNYRHLARVVIEAQTPLAIGTGKKSLESDSCIARDINGLPFIPGTSLAGVLSHGLKNAIKATTEDDTQAQSAIDDLFGLQTEKSTRGSKLMITDALMLGPNNTINDGLYENINSLFTQDFYKEFTAFPIRDHVRITHKGVAADQGKFDEEVAYKGMRFVFEIEVVDSNENDSPKLQSLFDQVVDLLLSAQFRVGSGTRSGFGEMSVVSLQKVTLDLADKEKDSLKKYIQKSSSLNDSTFWTDIDSYTPKKVDQDHWLTYDIILEPEDFFHFGSGSGDNEVDMTTVKEKYITWDDNKPRFVQQDAILIPSTSIKGALSHRVAYLWNKKEGKYGDNALVGHDNPAVSALFGSEGKQVTETDSNGKVTTQTIDKKRGNVLFSDILLNNEQGIYKEKILNHVAIDRFTGGTIPGALFSEKVTIGKGHSIECKISLDEKAIEAACVGTTKDKVIAAFESALQHVCDGLLPLGGGVQRGHGAMTGKYIKNGEKAYNYEN